MYFLNIPYCSRISFEALWKSFFVYIPVLQTADGGSEEGIFKTISHLPSDSSFKSKQRFCVDDFMQQYSIIWHNLSSSIGYRAMGQGGRKDSMFFSIYLIICVYICSTLAGHNATASEGEG